MSNKVSTHLSAEDVLRMDAIIATSQSASQAPKKDAKKFEQSLAGSTPTHCLVIKAPWAQMVLDGKKKREFRNGQVCKMLAGKTVAISVAKTIADHDHIKTPKRCLQHRGLIVGQATFGVSYWDDLMEQWHVKIVEASWWPESSWIASPGGLGLRPIPSSADKGSHNE